MSPGIPQSLHPPLILILLSCLSPPALSRVDLCSDTCIDVRGAELLPFNLSFCLYYRHRVFHQHSVKHTGIVHNFALGVVYSEVSPGVTLPFTVHEWKNSEAGSNVSAQP
ncbi:hypothetical protein ATANTOWER_032730 [Ataeniobius toweri]|uniref:Uncharacterized protein n=1 Tax=Ataeniobius toweri TaxID=208326 RepID=A0ABU7A3E8_9TELE|nr:hypothetical protein [Ataeniobius toweri]